MYSPSSADVEELITTYSNVRSGKMLYINCDYKNLTDIHQAFISFLNMHQQLNQPPAYARGRPHYNQHQPTKPVLQLPHLGMQLRYVPAPGLTLPEKKGCTDQVTNQLREHAPSHADMCTVVPCHARSQALLRTMHKMKSLQQHGLKILTKKVVDTLHHHGSECPCLLCVSACIHSRVR